MSATFVVTRVQESVVEVSEDQILDDENPEEAASALAADINEWDTVYTAVARA